MGGLMPAVSVVMPVFNREGVVMRAVESVLAQSLAEFELIVVDDGSMDGTIELLGKISDRRLRLVRQPRNQGSNAARNVGLAASKAPLICFLDSDDEFMPGKLEAIAGFFHDHPEVELLLDSYAKVNPARPTPKACLNPSIDDSAQFLSALVGARGKRLYKSVSGISLRRSALERIGPFDESLPCRQDLDFLLRAAGAVSCAATDRLLWIKHWSDDSITADKGRFMPATLALARRHSFLVDDPLLAGGFAHDIWQHTVELRRAGQIRPAAANIVKLVGGLGLGVSLWLAWRLVRRGRR